MRITVNTSCSNHASLSETAVVGLRQTPHLVAGQLDASDEKKVFGWASLNTAALLAYCDGQIDTIQLGGLLQPLT